ncbi:response regulator transcription factor [Thermodesulfobacteriota bacterium]
MAQILIIEDNLMLRKMISKQMEIEGHQVFEAANGALGIDIFDQQTIDIVITDIFMPEKEGIETIIELREKSQEVKIIAISVGGRDESVDYLALAKNLGADRIFKKPVRMIDLRKAVNELLG